MKNENNNMLMKNAGSVNVSVQVNIDVNVCTHASVLVGDAGDVVHVGDVKTCGLGKNGEHGEDVKTFTMCTMHMLYMMLVGVNNHVKVDVNRNLSKGRK